MIIHSRIILVGFISLLISSTHVLADTEMVTTSQVPKPEAVATPDFEIVRYQIEGNSLLSSEVISMALRPYVGTKRNFGDVQQALEALQSLYLSQGYASVQVILPEQELNHGVVVFNVVEQRVGQVSVEGPLFHDAENILRTVPSLKSGELPVSRQMSQNLRLANENPSKQTSIQFKSSESTPNTIDAIIKVTDEKPSKVFLTADNTGNKQTGNVRVGLGYQHYNMFNHDDRLSAQILTSPESFMEDVKIFAVGYSRPLYDWGDSLDFIAAYSDVNAGTILNGALAIASQGYVLGSKYNWNLRKWGDYDHKLVIGLDYKRFKPQTETDDGENQTLFASVTPLSLTYMAELEKRDWRLGYNLGVAHNLALGKDGGRSSLGQNDNVAFPWLSDVHFTKVNLGVDLSKAVLDGWIAHAGVSAQWTDDHLHPGEQFGVGGMDSVRGWNERSFAADKGYRATVDLTSPDFGSRLASNVAMRSVLFLDKGYVKNNKDILGTEPAADIDIASVGAGLRMSFSKKLLGRLDYAYVIQGDKTNDEDATHAQRHRAGDHFGHFSLVWVW